MASYRITYTDKNKNAPLGTFEGQWRDADANEVKRVVNNLAALINPDGIELPPGGVGDVHISVVITGVDDITISHGLGKKPSVQVFNSQAELVEAWFKHINENSVRHVFNKPFTGTITYN
jgi:hypothetical protein